jgi:Mg2+ and Co2+ transporter CorA
MERLAVIAAITLPITALSSVFGMNVIVQGLVVSESREVSSDSLPLLVW